MTGTAWPPLPEIIPAGVDPAGNTWELRRVTPETAGVVEASVPSEQQAETFHFFTRLPIPLAAFLAADPGRRTYALWRDGTPLACTSVYDGDPRERRVSLGFTWVAPDERGAGANRALKTAMFDALQEAGVSEVWFRADVANLRSCRSLEKAGAEWMFVDPEPRVYPDRVSRSVHYRRRL